MLSSMAPAQPLPDLSGFLSAPKALPWAQHVFGTRDLGLEGKTTDSNATVRSYTERFGPIAHMRQVHGTRVVQVSGSGLVDEADAIYTDEPGLWVAVKTADCVPVLISGQGIVAAVHAGWRGLHAGIIEQTIDTLADYTGMHPEDFHLAIGPCISQSCYEVPDTFTEYFDEKFFRESPNGADKKMLDLPGVARQQALAAGLPGSQVRDIGRCTYSEPMVFNSYRRHSHRTATGQPTQPYTTQLSLIRIAPKR